MQASLWHTLGKPRDKQSGSTGTARRGQFFLNGNLGECKFVCQNDISMLIKSKILDLFKPMMTIAMAYIIFQRNKLFIYFMYLSLINTCVFSSE